VLGQIHAVDHVENEDGRSVAAITVPPSSTSALGEAGWPKSRAFIYDDGVVSVELFVLEPRPTEPAGELD
jgi:hypothetical protein